MLNDIRQACRAILKMPVLATVVVVSLGVGIGVNTAVFSWIEAAMLRPLPGVPDAGGFLLLEPRAETGSYPGVSWAEYSDLRGRLSAMPDPIASRIVPFNVGEPGRTERAYGQLVSGNFFSALGLTPAAGRFLRADEAARPGGEPVAVVSYEYWQTRFGGTADVVGRTIRVNDRLLTIVGVAPPRFQGTVLGLHFDLWTPATLAPVLLNGSRELEDRSLRGYAVMGRLAAGANRVQAQAELDRAMRELAAAYPETNGRLQAELLRFWDAPRGPQRMFARALWILQGVMLLLLLAVCGNTANLMLARASARQREIGVRVALGAGRWRIARLLLTENLLLSLAGAAFGAVVATWATEALRAVPLITAFPVRFQTRVDSLGLAFTLALGLASGLIVGLAPAIQLVSLDPQSALRAGGRAAGRSRLRHALMAIEVGLATTVLLAAALFLRAFGETRDTDPGFRREGVLLAAFDYSGRNPDEATRRDFTRRLLERLRALPAVEAASVASQVPLDIHGFPLRAFSLEGRVRSDATPDRALGNVVSPGYFKTMGIPLVRGSDFVELDDATTPAQAIVNEEFVRRYLEGGEPVGRRVQTRGEPFVIAGVVRNSLSESFSEPPTPVIYLSYRDWPSSRGEIHVRTRAGAETLLAPQVERVVRDLDPTLPLYDARTLSDHIEKNLFLRRIPARMFAFLGPALLLLAAIGIYAVVAYTVSLRTTEIGVRIALGATTQRVVNGIVADSLRVVSAGAAVGWVLVVVVSLHLVRGPLYLSVFGGVPAVLLLVSGLACWLPARRATAVDPVIALRHE